MLGQKKLATAALNAAKVSATTTGFLRNGGRALAAVGLALEVGKTIQDDLAAGDSVVDTTVDVAATVLGDGATIVAPPLAAVDLVTAGALPSGIKNAVNGGQAIAKLATSRVSLADADRIKTKMTRNWPMALARDAGEYWAQQLGY